MIKYYESSAYYYTEDIRDIEPDFGNGSRFNVASDVCDAYLCCIQMVLDEKFPGAIVRKVDCTDSTFKFRFEGIIEDAEDDYDGDTIMIDYDTDIANEANELYVNEQFD